MNVRGKKHVISLILKNRNLLLGTSSGFVLILIAILNFTFIGPLFIPAIPRQPHVKDITFIIPNDGVEIAASSIRNSGFRKIHALSYDDRAQNHQEFTSYSQIKGTFCEKIAESVNTTFVLFGSTEAFAVPAALPKLPDKPMVIGYSFVTCNEQKYALIGPIQIEGSMVTVEALKRFWEFSETLKGEFSKNEKFRIFCDLHSLRLLMLPCKKRTDRLPKWESLDVIEYENIGPLKPWDSIPHVEEVWSIGDLI
jgi:hypothetical protein